MPGNNPVVKVPLPKLPETHLFDRVETLYASARTSIFRFLRKLRKQSTHRTRGKRRRSAVASTLTGRSTRVVSYVRGVNRPAPLQSIMTSVRRGHYDLRERRIRVSRSDLVGWHRTENENLTLILLVDVSNSTFPFLAVFKEILHSLADYFKRHQDRVGLISLQGTQAKIHIHPTHNFRVVARGLTKLRIHGETPLADGLSKSLHMARAERNKNPGSRSVVILLSDCFPEPIAPGYETIFDNPAYRDSLNLASTYRRQKISLLVINPTYVGKKAQNPGEILAERLAEGSGGRLIRLKRHADVSKLQPSRQEIDEILSGVERFFTEQK